MCAHGSLDRRLIFILITVVMDPESVPLLGGKLKQLKPSLKMKQRINYVFIKTKTYLPLMIKTLHQ